MHHTVVIAGAGPTGVTAAILLGQHDVDVLLLDRWTDVYPQPRAVHLDDEVYRILAKLGVAEEFAAISRPGAGLRLLSPDHQVLSTFDRTNPRTVNGFPAANMFDQPDLEAILRKRLTAYQSVTLLGGAEITAVTNGSRPSVTFERDGVPETVTAEFLLGCDGANSLTRAAIGSAMENLRFEQRWLVLDIATDRELGHWEGVHQVCDTTRAATYMRIGERRHRWEFQLLDHETAADFSTLAAVAPLLAPWDTDLDGFEVIRTAEYTFRAQLADRWRSGRTFLLGDAAHLTPPFIGQGMGAGLRDAANLTWKIAGVLDGSLPESALETYEQERRPHAAALIRLAIGVGAAMTAGGRLGDLLRSVLAPRLHRLPGIGARVVESTSPALRRSALVRRGRLSRSLAGTLAPNIDDRTGGGWAWVTTGPASPRPGAVTIEARGELATWLRSGRARGALVRPDFTVAEVTR
ncbi:3-(3-hydroxy-phenyl)propionate hydroxylase [Marmoricola sp. OAE513]|uniref:bifunctional 3-(3-hydroxy-phenyl)propionate/3-hydroxycinnamic acid hydroxylase MhpA n=1 Tax=Marmoricola sp. OAE513 TaxID=2817894 RepID=UPI001AE9D9BC